MKLRTLIFILSLTLLCGSITGLVFSLFVNHETSHAASNNQPIITQPAQPTTAAAPQLAAVAEPRNNLTLAGFALTNDPYIENQWALALMPDLLTNHEASENIIVAVLDTGIDTQHEDLSSKIKDSIIFSNSSTYSDLNGHGTHVAGIIAATADNSIGIAGAAPCVSLLNVKVAEDNGMVWDSNVAQGIRWALEHGANVINMSLTAPSCSSELIDAVNCALNRGVVLVAAAGNSGKGETYPAAIPGVIAVAALNPDRTLWVESNNAAFVDAYAPGVDIYSTLPRNHYGYYSGSSMAAAYVSAAAALALDYVEDMDADGLLNDEVADLVQNLFSKP